MRNLTKEETILEIEKIIDSFTLQDLYCFYNLLEIYDNEKMDKIKNIVFNCKDCQCVLAERGISCDDLDHDFDDWEDCPCYVLFCENYLKKQIVKSDSVR